MSDFSDNKAIALEFMKKHKKADRHEFAKRTGLGDGYYYRARQVLGIKGYEAGTKTNRIAEYLRKNPGTTTKELMHLFQCAHTTCSDARAIVDIWQAKRKRVMDLPDNEFVDLRKYGFYYREIGEFYGVHATTVRNRVLAILGPSKIKKVVSSTLEFRDEAPRIKPRDEAPKIDPSNYNKLLTMKWL